MADLEIFSMDENGAGWKKLSDLTQNEKLDLEIGLLFDDVKINCVVCFSEIEKGTGNTCENCKK